MRQRQPRQQMTAHGRINPMTAVLALGLVLAGAALIYWIRTRPEGEGATPSGEPGRLILTSPTANARASLDGQDQGRLPLALNDLPPGKSHYVKVEASEHAPVVEQIVLEPGESRTLDLRLRKLKAGELGPVLPDKPLVSPDTGQVQDGAFEIGLDAYRRGQFGKAARHFVELRRQAPDPEVQGRAQALADRIEQFARLHRQIHDPATPGSSVPDLVLETLGLDREIDARRPYAHALDRQLLEGLRKRGRARASQGELLSARADFLLCLEFQPGNAGCARSLEGLKEQAKKLYYAAYMQRRQNPDGSARMIRHVLGTLDRSDPTYEKAEQLLRLVGTPE